MTRACPACGNDGTVIAAQWFGSAELVRCVRCRTEWVSPQPSDERLAQIYGPDYYEPWALEDPSGPDAMKRRTFEPLLEVCAINPGASVLDVGCATGSFLAFAHEHGHKVFGVDLNPHAIEEAARRVPEATLHAGTLRDLPFVGHAFDAIVMVDFIEHVREPMAELERARDRLAPEGVMVLSTPRADSASRKLLRRAWPQYREEHLTYFSLDGMRALLGKLDLEIARSRVTRKAITLAYAYGQAKAYPVPGITQLTTAAYSVAPFARHRPIRMPFGEMTVVARRPR